MKRFIERIAPYGGFGAVFFELLAIGLFAVLLPSVFGQLRPISYYDTHPQTKIIFVVCYSLAALSFAVFIKYHVARYFWVPVRLFLTSMGLFIATAVIPFEPEYATSEHVHQLLALSFAGTLVLSVYLVYLHATDKQLRNVSGAVVLAAGIFTIISAVSGKQQGPILIYQFIIGIACQYWTIWVSRYTLRRPKPSGLL